MELRDTFGLEAMKAELIRDEGLVLEVYKDPGSGRAIGVGRNLDTQGMSTEEWLTLGLTKGFGGGEGRTCSGDAAVDPLARGISKAAAMTLLVNDIKDRAHQLDIDLPWWRLLSPVRQRVLINMAFEMGTHGMIHKMDTGWGIITDVQRGLFEGAADTMLQTPWGQGKTKNRAHRLAQMMRWDRAVDEVGQPQHQEGRDA